MKKYYDKVSLKSRFVNYMFKFTGAKKNYLTEKNIKKFIEKYKKTIKNYNLFEELGLKKEVFGNNDVYLYNGDFNNSKGRVLIYIHGGSFLEEAISYQVNFACKIARLTKSTLIIPRYTLIPEGNYKNLYELMDLIYERINTKNVEFNLLGDSCGGGFILAYTMYLRDRNKLLPKNVLMLSPWLDLAMENKELINSMKLDNMSAIEGNVYCGKLWADDLDVKNSLISPMYGNLDRLPKMTIATGGFDILKPECIRFSKLLDEKSIDYNYIEYKNQGHVFGCYPTKEGKLLISDFSKILNNEDIV